MFFDMMKKPNISSTPPLPASDPGSAVPLGSKRVKLSAQVLFVFDPEWMFFETTTTQKQF